MSQTSISMIPTELWLEIAQVGRPLDALRLGMTCKMLKIAIHSRSLWEQFLKRASRASGIIDTNWDTANMRLREVQQAVLRPEIWRQRLNHQQPSTLSGIYPRAGRVHWLRDVTRVWCLCGGRFIVAVKERRAPFDSEAVVMDLGSPGMSTSEDADYTVVASTTIEKPSGAVTFSACNTTTTILVGAVWLEETKDLKISVHSLPMSTSSPRPAFSCIAELSIPFSASFHHVMLTPQYALVLLGDKKFLLWDYVGHHVVQWEANVVPWRGPCILFPHPKAVLIASCKEKLVLVWPLQDILAFAGSQASLLGDTFVPIPPGQCVPYPHSRRSQACGAKIHCAPAIPRPPLVLHIQRPMNPTDDNPFIFSIQCSTGPRSWAIRVVGDGASLEVTLTDVPLLGFITHAMTGRYDSYPPILTLVKQTVTPEHGTQQSWDLSLPRVCHLTTHYTCAISGRVAMSKKVDDSGVSFGFVDITLHS